jgi:putative ABC transport system permease protein
MQEQLRAEPGISTHRGSSNLKVTARLRPGVTRQEAEAALNVVHRQLEASYPQVEGSGRKPRPRVELAPVGAYPSKMLVGLLGVAALLIGIVGSVLLIACANVAGMLLARATVRHREMAVRLAVGASRGRLIRQLLTESSLLFLTAGTFGVLLAIWLTQLIAAIPVPVAIPFALEVQVDWRVLGFTLVLALATGIVFGLAPALQASRTDLQSALKDSTSALGLKRSRVRQAFVVGQMTLSLVLLIGAGLFTRALTYGQSVYPGREPETVMTATLDPRVLGYTVPQARELYRQLTDNIAALPGVAGVSGTRELSIGGGFARTGVFVEDAPGLGSVATETSTIAPRYFETLDVRLVAGRDFTAADREGAPTVVIINEAMARRYWPDASPVGKRVRFDENEWAEIVGVAEDGRYRVAGQSPAPFIYYPLLQSGSDHSVTLLVRFRGDKASLLADVRRKTRELDPRLPLLLPMTLAAAVETATLPWRIAGALARGFGLLGLALAALGIYGLVSYTVSQRTREIGVRVALGAAPGNIRNLVVGHGLKLAVIGVGIGLVLSLGVTRLLAAFLFGISASDPVTYLGTALLLAAMAIAASYFPARKATRTDPMVALRQD